MLTLALSIWPFKRGDVSLAILPPAGFVFLTEENGVHLSDADGALLLEAL